MITYGCMYLRSMQLMNALNAFHPLEPRVQDLLLECVVSRQLPKGHHLLELGKIDRELHFIEKGSGRVYYLKDGNDITDYIAMDGQFLGGVSSVFSKLPSEKAIELTEDSIVQSINAEAFETLAGREHQVETLFRKLMTWAFLLCQQRVESIRFHAAAERYALLEKQYPGISNRIPLKHIASYIGTTQVSLSRIRAGIQ
ncbi:cyclic nucleotide-binding domain-containing protein [bacterium]|nr:cyclic nucleotide-binding domain-containing protein [bacterium]